MSLDYLTGNVPSQGSVTPLIDGFNYFNDLFTELATLQSGDKVYLMNWQISSHFYHRADENDTILNTGKEKYLVEILQQLVARGVDVRIMIWVNTSMFNPFYPIPRALKEEAFTRTPVSSVLEGNSRTVFYWRQKALDDELEFTQPNLALDNSILVNTVDAFIGGCHSKFVLVLRKKPTSLYEGIGYTGGIDFGMSRYGQFWHRAIDDGWHDLQVRVEGGAIISDLYLYYQQIWDENVRRKNKGFNPTVSFWDEGQHLFVPCIPAAAGFMEDLSFHYEETGHTQLIQSLRTLPDIYPIFQEPEISFAQDGVFEIRQALEHAIARAETYIYIEDQGMESLEIFDLLGEALVQKPALKIILVTGLTDPADPPSDNIEKVLLYHLFYSSLNEDQQSRIHFLSVRNYVIHSKVFLFDDKLAIVGSAGMFTRSLTEETEHAIAFIDQGEENHAVKTLREKLWAELLQVAPGDFSDKYATLSEAMKVWDPQNTEDDLIKLPLYARGMSDFPSEAILKSDYFLIPYFDEGAVRTAVLSEAEKQALNHSDELKDKSFQIGPVILVKDLYFNVFRLGLLIIHAETEGGEPLLFPIKLNYDGGDLPGGVENLSLSPDGSTQSLEDERLVCRESNILLDEDGTPVLDKFKVNFNFSLSRQGLLIACTQGANMGQVRLIKQHEGRQINFDAFDAPIDVDDFNYSLLHPLVGPIQLQHFDSDITIPVVISGINHLLTREIIFSKFFNQGYNSHMASPVPYGKKAAIHEKVTLRLNASSLGTITWAYEEEDGHPQEGTGDGFEIQFTSPGIKTVYASHHIPDRSPLKYEVQVEVLKNSGAEWVAEFPTSRETADLAEPFRSYAEAFIDAIEEAGLSYQIFATLRPHQRAYLMAKAYQITKGKDPGKIDERIEEVNISWVHYTANGMVDLPASRAAAQTMVTAYNIGETGAVYPSKHSDGEALDMKVEIPTPVQIRMNSGNYVPLVSQRGLKKVGASYKLKRLKLSNHWSLNGH